MNATKTQNNYRYIPNYEGLYSIDTDGNVFSHITNKILKPQKVDNGYLQIMLVKDGIKKRVSIHRLVALTFIQNPDDLPVVDHIDTDKTNNNVSNLKWCTQKENSRNPLSLKHLSTSTKGKKKRPMAEETKQKLSQAIKGRVMSEEFRIKISNSRRGYIMPDEQKQKISENRKGKNTGKNNAAAKSVIQYDLNMTPIKTWEYISLASQELGICSTSISNCLKERSKTAGGFIWKYQQ